ncbi:sterol desaturase family protein [Mariprofundus erugo]|uniref:sterol desaturase family protein n=1 Tax=Mariprofundus erugo TaxID=2528639 RepID=UPI001EE85D62|nr:sterol desaturase family protein [Mariprofundus erugo]
MDEQSIRLSAFLAVLIVMAVAEGKYPCRPLRFGRRRWPANLAMVVLNSMMMRILPVSSASAVAIWANAHSVGLLNQFSLPEGLEVALAIVLLDLAIYGQHVLFHAVPLLWRLHLVHHADRDIDVTTALRFHPLEMILSLLIKAVVVILLGAPVLAVLLFEVILNAMAMFNHANLRLPRRLDGLLRWLLVTPDMHRVHHSILRHETNSNYGFNLSVWDRWFGTWRAQPEGGHQAMVIGLAHLQQAPTHTLLYMLRLPFSGEIGQYPMLHRKSEQQEGDGG